MTDTIPRLLASTEVKAIPLVCGEYAPTTTEIGVYLWDMHANGYAVTVSLTPADGIAEAEDTLWYRDRTDATVAYGAAAARCQRTALVGSRRLFLGHLLHGPKSAALASA